MLLVACRHQRTLQHGQPYRHCHALVELVMGAFHAIVVRLLVEVAFQAYIEQVEWGPGMILRLLVLA